jgi:hypothetical protein
MQRQHFVAALEEILTQGADRELDTAACHQLDQVGAFVVVQHAWFHESQLHRRHLDALAEIHAAESIPEAAKLQDIVLARRVIGVFVSVFGRHGNPL